jgi:ABC-type uncharacterized transport system auxiliary subunit
VIGGSRVPLVVAEPTTVQALDSDRIIVKDSSGALSFRAARNGPIAFRNWCRRA